MTDLLESMPVMSYFNQSSISLLLKYIISVK